MINLISGDTENSCDIGPTLGMCVGIHRRSVTSTFSLDPFHQNCYPFYYSIALDNHIINLASPEAKCSGWIILGEWQNY